VSESLKNKTVKGVSWSFADNIANSGITFLVGLVLARLLAPSEYGILAMISIFIAISNSIIDSGFSNALIRKIKVQQIDYNTVFYFNLIVSGILYIILFYTAPYISFFFKEPILTNVTRVIGLVLLINAAAIIPRTIFVRNVNFKSQTQISFISSILSGIIGIVLAVCGLGIWSLVSQQISRQILNTVLLWIYCKWYPTWEFSIDSFKELFSFGSKLLVSGLLDTIYKNIYYVIIGHFYSSNQLGQYTRAEQFDSMFSSNLTSVVQRVSYPVLSSIQNENDRLKQAYRQIIKVTMLVTFACMFGLAATAKSLVIILIGEKWLLAVPFIQIMCFAEMLYPLHAINLNILQVKGRSDLFLKLEIVKKIIGIIPIIIGIFCGIEKMLWGSVLTSFIAYFLNSYYSANLINYPTKKQIQDVLPTFTISLIVAAIMWSVSLLNISVYITFVVQCLLGLFLSFVIYSKIKLDEFIEIKQLVVSLIKNNKK